MNIQGFDPDFLNTDTTGSSSSENVVGLQLQPHVVVPIEEMPQSDSAMPQSNLDELDVESMAGFAYQYCMHLKKKKELDKTVMWATSTLVAIIAAVFVGILQANNLKCGTCSVVYVVVPILFLIPVHFLFRIVSQRLNHATWTVNFLTMVHLLRHRLHTHGATIPMEIKFQNFISRRQADQRIDREKIQSAFLLATLIGLIMAVVTSCDMVLCNVANSKNPSYN